LGHKIQFAKIIPGGEGRVINTTLGHPVKLTVTLDPHCCRLALSVIILIHFCCYCCWLTGLYFQNYYCRFRRGPKNSFAILSQAWEPYCVCVCTLVLWRRRAVVNGTLCSIPISNLHINQTLPQIIHISYPALFLN